MQMVKSGLYGSLVANFIPPFVAISLTVGSLLALLYGSSVYGGHAWISKSNQGAVPQIFEMLDASGQGCFSNVVASRNAPCLTSKGQDDTPFVHAVYLDEGETKLLAGEPMDLSPFRRLMERDGGVSGFTAMNGRVVHVVVKPDTHDELVLVTDVTETLARRLAAAGAVEVELYQDSNMALLGSTWRGRSNEQIVQISELPPKDVRWHKTEFTQPYRGYDAGDDHEYVVFSEGRRSFSNFARSFIAPEIAEMPAVRSVIYVPSAVMLYYTNIAVGLYVAVTVVVFGGTLFMLRRLTHRQIDPIIALSRRVRKIRSRIGGQDSEHTEPHGRANAEIADLAYAIDRLEIKLIENDRLERRMRLHERLESIGRLTGGIAHDFNNLLNIVLANCSFLIEDVQDEEILEPVRDIEGAARSAAEMTRGLLAFSSGRASEIAMGRNVSNEVLTTVHLIGRTLGPEIALEVDVGDSVAMSMSGAQLQQVLMNLILNARDASRLDGVKIKVGLHEAERAPPHRPDDAPSDWLLLSVEDNGVGMDQETVSQIFDPFFSLKGVGKSPGTGLGLSVVYGLVDGAGGSIDVSSARGQGSTFAVFIPRAKVQSANVKDLPSPAALNGLDVLLVEDDERVRRAVTTLLERLGMSVRGFGSGYEAIEWLSDGSREAGVDLVVTDIRMPGMDGYEVAGQCRGILRNVPVMFMTGFDPEALDRLVPENSTLVMKPMGIEEFLIAANSLQRVVGNDFQPLLPS